MAGGAVSLFLARAGHRITLLERAPAVGPVGAGFLLQPSGQRVLHSLGLLDSIVAQSARIERLEAVTHDGRPLTDLRYSRVLRGACAYGVHRGVLFTALHSVVAAAGIPIVLDAEITRLDETGDAVTLHDQAGRTHGPFDLAICTDGSRSHLRDLLDPHPSRPRILHEYPHGAIWGVGPAPWPTDSLYQITLGTHGLAGLLPIGRNRCGFFWGLPTRAWPAVRERGFAAFTAEVSALCPAATDLLAALGTFDHLTFGTYRHGLPRRLHTQRIVLAGDAAHAMSPHLGQGANLALLDAESLARHISTAPTLPAALQSYTHERRAPSRYFATLSHWLSPFFQSDHNVLALGRDLALPLLCEIPWTRRQMELSVAGLKTGFFHRLFD